MNSIALLIHECKGNKDNHNLENNIIKNISESEIEQLKELSPEKLFRVLSGVIKREDISFSIIYKLIYQQYHQKNVKLFQSYLN